MAIGQYHICFHERQLTIIVVYRGMTRAIGSGQNGTDQRFGADVEEQNLGGH